jgi:hypothetical protein
VECRTRKNAVMTELETSARPEKKRMTNHNTPKLSGMDSANHCADFPGLSALSITTILEEMTNISHKYKDKLTAHSNELATTLLNDEVEPRRLKSFKPADLMKQHI